MQGQLGNIPVWNSWGSKCKTNSQSICIAKGTRQTSISWQASTPRGNLDCCVSVHTSSCIISLEADSQDDLQKLQSAW